MPYEYEGIYTPQTSAIAAGEQALVHRQKQHSEELDAWEREKERIGTQMRAYREKIEADKMGSRQEQADNWREQDLLASERSALDDEYTLYKRDQSALVEGRTQQQVREGERRNRRSNSTAFIEDNFAEQTPREVVEFLNNPSLRLKRQAMDNISFCVNGSVEMPPSFVRFKADDIATVLLPKLHTILSIDAGPAVPTNVEKQFAEDIVASPAMAKALALNDQCRLLATYLLDSSEVINRLAICSFRQMVKLDPAVVKNAYEALDAVIERIQTTDSASASPRPSVEFFAEIAPKVVVDCLNNNFFDKISPLAGHKIDAIRQAALPKILHEARSSDRVRSGLVEAHTLRCLQSYFERPQPPPDTTEFFTALLPLIAQKLCRDIDDVHWLIGRLASPNAKVTAPVVKALRMSSRKEDSVVHDTFVRADLLHHLDNPPTQASFEITKLICDLLPVLAVPHTKSGTCSRIVRFLDHAEGSVNKACVTASKRIVDSTPENRALLFEELRKLDLARESTLDLLDYILPLRCRDWAASGNLDMISKMLSHAEPRVRVHAHQVWREVLFNTPEARTRVPISTIFKLCSSAHEDCIALGAQILPTMAIEIARGGSTSVNQVLHLSNNPRLEMRKAAVRTIQKISDSGSANCEVLHTAGTFLALKQNLIGHPLDNPDIVQGIFSNLVPYLSQSLDTCRGFLELLNSTVPQVVKVARSILIGISTRNMTFRDTLRNAVLESLDQTSEPLIEFCAKAIKDWIGPDLALSGGFAKLIQLASHTDRRIQTEVLFTLKQIISNGQHHDALVRDGIVPAIQSLSSDNTSEVVGFVALALRVLALTLVRRGHVADVIRFASSDVVRLREGGYAAVEVIANGLEQDRKCLVDQDIIERATGDYDEMSLATLKFAQTIIKKVAIDYVRGGKVHILIPLVNHKQESIRLAAKKSLETIADATEQERKALRLALLPILSGASPSLLDVASACLQRTFARDLINASDFKQIFDLLGTEHECIRAPLISELERHIHASDETARRILVDAGILNAILHPSTGINTTDDLLSFIVRCVLPELGPSFTQSDGGASIIPLLKHEESHIRAAAATAIKNAVESRHGNLKNLTDARIISILYSAIEDDSVRNLWCDLLPRTAPFLSNRDEIDILFGCLTGHLNSIRQAASEAISIMARTSDETRLNLFTSLFARLDGPPPASMRQIAHAVSLSGFAFAFRGKEVELLDLIRTGEPSLSEAAVDAVTHLVSDGGPTERQALIDARIFAVAVDLYKAGSERRLSLKLLHIIIQHLIHLIIVDERSTNELLYLFDDPDAALSQVLYTSLVGQVAGNPASQFPQAIPFLLETERQRRPFVAKLLCKLATQMVDCLLVLERPDIIVKLLEAEDVNISGTYLEQTLVALRKARDSQKDLICNDPHFAIVVALSLNARNPKKRRISSEIITVVAEKSAPRSVKLLEEGVASTLARISMESYNEASDASLTALSILFTSSPHQVSQDCIPALSDILNDPNRSVESYAVAFDFLKGVVTQIPHSAIIVSGIVRCLVNWISPQHTIVDVPCRCHAFEICEVIAQNSDPGRRALLDYGILHILVRLSADAAAVNVIGACKLLLALAYTGTYKSELITAGVRTAMERITSVIQKSTLSDKADKKLAQDVAKEVLATLQMKTARLTRNKRPVGDLSPNSATHVDPGASTRPRISRSVSESVGQGPRQSWIPPEHPRSATDNPGFARHSRMTMIREGDAGNADVFNPYE